MEVSQNPVLICEQVFLRSSHSSASLHQWSSTLPNAMSDVDAKQQQQQQQQQHSASSAAKAGKTPDYVFPALVQKERDGVDDVLALYAQLGEVTLYARLWL